ncbi:CARDB domain-containing protein [Anaerobacterium chartisolvens]|uniref:CARDB domain-containing protein n=1 Tax=Anaerobacterium chartisolvens TaxID=1297424 RepID=UPI000DF4C72E|nr:CARDB domain-containing protein [Anaerobacterium chartisolvens]
MKTSKRLSRRGRHLACLIISAMIVSVLAGFPAYASGNADVEVSYIQNKVCFEEEWLTTNVVFKNNSGTSLSGVPIQIQIDGKTLSVSDYKIPKTVSIPANLKVTIPVTWYAGTVDGGTEKKVAFRASVIPPEELTDTGGENNIKTEVTLVRKYAPDFEVVSISPASYREFTSVNTVITVANNSKENYKGVTVTLSINGHSIQKKVDLPAGSKRNVLLTWDTPSAGTDVTISARINPANSPVESNTANNALSKKVTIASYNPAPYRSNDAIRIVPPPSPCTNNNVTWSEIRDNWQHEQVRTGTGHGTDAEGNPTSWPIYEWKWVNYPYEKTFNAKLNVEIIEVREVFGSGRDIVNPTEMKSGYGIEVTLATEFVTNYDRGDSIFGPQYVYAYFPEHEYTYWEEMESSSSPGSSKNTWKFRINPSSGLNRREHNIPVNFPDNESYTLYFKAVGASAGESGGMCDSLTSGIYINGNMYQDDTTGGSN